MPYDGKDVALAPRLGAGVTEMEEEEDHIVGNGVAVTLCVGSV